MSLLIFLSANFYATPSKHLLPQRPYHFTTTVSLFTSLFWVPAYRYVLHCFRDYIFHLLQLLIYTKMLLSLSFCSIPDRLYVFLVCVFSSFSFRTHSSFIHIRYYQSIFCHTFFTWYYLGISNYRSFPLCHKDIIHCAFYRCRCIWH